MPNQRDDDYDFQRNPLQVLRHQVDQLNEYYEAARDREELAALNQEELNRQAARRRETHAWARDQVQRYSQANPEYAGAFEWLLEREGQVLSNAGLSPLEVNQALNTRADQLFEYSRARNINPAAALYETAETYGYKPDGKWINYLSDDEFDSLWRGMEERDRTERYYGDGRPRQTSREGIPISTPEEEAGGLEDWLWKRAGSGKRR